MKNQFTIDPECSTIIKYNSLRIVVEHFEEDKEEAEEIARQIAQIPILTESDKEFLKIILRQSAILFQIEVLEIDYPEKLGELAEKIGLDPKFVKLMKGVV